MIIKKRHRKQDYYEYLKSKSWKLFRELALEHHGRKCQKCSFEEKLEVHHKHYRTLFQERFEDVEILCKGCHKGHHKDRAWKNGKKSKYMRNPAADTTAVTFYPNRRVTQVGV